MKDVIKSRVFSSHIKLYNGLYYEFDVFETDRSHVVDVKSADLTKPLNKVKVFDPTEIKPCSSYRLYSKVGDLNTVGIEGYTADDKLAYTLEYNEKSNHPAVLIDLNIPKKAYENTHRVREGIPKEEDKTQKVDNEQAKPLPAMKRLTEIKDIIDGFVYSLFVETFTDATCKLVLTKYSGYPVSLRNQIWFSEILTMECDMYSIELQDDNTVKVYGSRPGYNEYKTFHWDEKGILLTISR